MNPLATRIHLDPLGGIAGDMFVAALVDTFPQLEQGVLDAVRTLPAPRGSEVRFASHRDAILGGRRFVVKDPTAGESHHHKPVDDGHKGREAHTHGGSTHVHGSEDTHGESHSHTDYATIRTLLDKAALTPSVRAHAHGMFHLLAVTEAQVHGIRVDEVTFHEVGAWDSIVDFVAAAYLLDQAGNARWTWSALPLGGGRMRTAHGIMSIPAPATSILIRGMDIVDDGITGERVTPTGATILRYLLDKGHGSANATAMVASATGYGFGARTMPGISNVLRCIAFTVRDGVVPDERVSVINFEVDDQSNEDLAIALDRLRNAPGVLDVVQSSVIGKKGRLSSAVQLQVRPGHVNDVVEKVFLETTTIGLRISDVTRRVLPRQEVGLGNKAARVKVTQRPRGVATAKAEIDDVANLDGWLARMQARAEAEQRAMRERES